MSVGIHVTPHALRRTFALVSLRWGLYLLSLWRFLGHSSVEMTSHYVQVLDSDLLKAHRAHGMGSWLWKRRAGREPRA
jgi:site-specific recombinase XerD